LIVVRRPMARPLSLFASRCVMFEWHRLDLIIEKPSSRGRFKWLPVFLVSREKICSNVVADQELA